MKRARPSRTDKSLILRRVLIYGAAIFFLGIFQCAFFSRLKPFGATPDLIICAVCAILLTDDKYAALVCAVCGGYFIDAIGAVPPGFSPIVYVLTVALTASIAQKLLARIPSFLILLLPALAVRAVFTYVGLCLTFGSIAPLSSLTSVILPEAISTIFLSIPVYLLIKLCYLPIRSRNKFSF